MKIDKTKAINGDCMDYMRGLPDGTFDLAIVDPPYGINASKKRSYHANSFTKYHAGTWDSSIPDRDYFLELFRVSKRQIVWGGNYFTKFLPPMPKWIVWDKQQPQGIDQAMFELAWSSDTKKQSMIFRYSVIAGKNNISGNMLLAKKYARIHQTQKPIALYEWLLNNYARPGDRILDTHLGSGTHRIAAYNLNYEFVGIELDKTYYQLSADKFEEHKKQLQFF